MEGFGDQLKAMRTQRELSQDELAKALGLHQTTISGIERNERLPSLEILLAMSQLFEVPLEELLDEKALATSRAIARSVRSASTVKEVAHP